MGDRRAIRRPLHNTLPHDVRSRSDQPWTSSCAACSFAALVAIASLAISPGGAHAQRALGVGEDATVLPRGAVRVSAQATWSSYNELYGPGGQLESLGAPLSPDSLGVQQLAILRPLETSLRELAQQPNANVTLGPVRSDFRARVARSAFLLDFGLTSRIQLTGRLPYEHTISEIVFDANPRGYASHAANVGPNPALAVTSGAVAQNRRVVDSLLQAANELSGRLETCTTNPGDPVCTDRARVEALVQDARSFARGLAETYGVGADTARGSLFVPTVGSTLQSAISSRVASINASFRTFIPALSVWDTPFPAQVPVTAEQTQELLGDQLGIAPIAVVERSHIGDVEVGAKLLLIDTYGSLRQARASSGGGLRLAVGGLVRLGTAQVDRPDDLADIGTGDGQTDIEVSGIADVVLTRRFWASAVARYGRQLEDEKILRIPDVPRNPFLAAFREQEVGRDLGDYVELEATPRFVYNDYLSISAQWTYRRKAEDTYTGTFTVEDPDGESVTLDARALGVGTEQTEQRVGGGLSFSTLRAFDRGRARLPIEVHFLHTQVLSGSGYVPKRFASQLQVRYYTRVFGAPLR